MFNPEKTINPNAERRKKVAEEKNELSLSHRTGELHSHTGYHRWDAKFPEDVIESRKGSNCGDVPIELLVKFHAQQIKDEFIAITDHSRDGSPEEALGDRQTGITHWFYDMYRWNDKWILENFKKTKEELTPEDKNEIESRAKKEAGQVALYGDERLEQVLKDIEKIKTKNKLPIKILKGVEANLMPDGNFDTQMIEQNKFELVNCSIHPNTNKAGFAEIIKDPEKYSDLAIKGINNPKTNIICHLAYDCEKGFDEKLNWDEIAEAAIENNVAIEINLQNLMKYVYNEILDYEKYPDGLSYREKFKDMLPELVPLISSPIIREKLKPYIGKGLKIAINTDEHKNKFVKAENVTRDNYTEVVKDRGNRFWRCMKIAEKYFNELFNKLGIKKENIINTFSIDELEKFINK